MAIEYNEFVAQATNRQTAINILRARVREPLHFTSFSKVNGTARIEGSGSLTTTFNGNGGEKLPRAGGGGFDTSKQTIGATNWAPTLGVKVNSGTDFEIGINATDDFWKGILGPVAPSTLVYYLRQGWSRDLISYLFIRRMEMSAKATNSKGETVVVPLRDYVNSPEDHARVTDFINLMKCRTLSFVAKETPKTTLPINDVSSVSGIGTDVLGRVQLKPKAASNAIYSFDTPARNEFVIALSERNEDACTPVQAELTALLDKAAGDHDLVKPARQKETNKALGGPLAGEPSSLANGEEPDKGAPDTRSGASFKAENYFEAYQADLVIDVTLRSAEGVIYYLGEYIRGHSVKPKLSGFCPGKDKNCIPIIVVEERTEENAKTAFIEVEFQGKDYVIPSSGERITASAGRSSQVVTLIQQMLNLHRSAKDLPSSPVVRVIN